jgi:hypothetical protein
MSDKQINKDIHEKILKRCWHDLSYISEPTEAYFCPKCKEKTYEPLGLVSPDYLNSWNDYGELVKTVREDDKKWDDLVYFLSADLYNYLGCWTIMKDILFDPRKGSIAIWEFFCKYLAKDR